MDMDHLFTSVRSARMPGDVRLRLLEGCRDRRPEKIPLLPKAVLITVIAMLLAGIVAGASVSAGYFRDIKNLFGAITGTRYLNAEEEISVTASASGNTLRIRTEFLFPDEPPYPYASSLSLSGWQIADASGNVLFEGGETDPFPVENGRADILLPLESACPDGCTLTVSGFVSHKKADQPLPIPGEWRCPAELTEVS